MPPTTHNLQPATSRAARCLLIRNPVSRGALSDVRLDATLQIARDAGWHVECAVTERVGHAIEIARGAAARDIDVIIVNGGDGTINEVINGFVGRRDIALAVIPGGTANIWAKEIRVPKDPEAAMREIVGGERRRVDLGRAGDRYFLLMAGIGFDGAIVPDVSASMKRRFGASAYFVKGALDALRLKTCAVNGRIDGVAREGPMYWMLISNTRSYGGLIDIMYRAEADDGLLDVGVMRRGGAWHLLADGARLVFKRHDRSPNVDYIKARTIEIDTPDLPIQIDGEYAGTTPMRFEIVPSALTVIVPAGLQTPLLRADAATPPARA